MTEIRIHQIANAAVSALYSEGALRKHARRIIITAIYDAFTWQLGAWHAKLEAEMPQI